MCPDIEGVVVKGPCSSGHMSLRDEKSTAHGEHVQSHSSSVGQEASWGPGPPWRGPHLSLLKDHTPCREGPSWPPKRAGLPFQTLPWDRHVWGAECQLQHQPRQCWPSLPWDTHLTACVRARDSVPGALVQSMAPNTSWRACQPRRVLLSSEERGTSAMGRGLTADMGALWASCLSRAFPGQ